MKRLKTTTGSYKAQTGPLIEGLKYDIRVLFKGHGCRASRQDMRLAPMKSFDPNHTRCIFPKYGAIVDAAMRGKNLSATDVGKHLNVDPSGPAGWRRGFGRNGPTRTAQLEALLGVKLDMSEVVPSAKVNAAGNADRAVNGGASLTDPVLPHLAAIALAHGFKASFTPL